jgi:hypothetical protein
MPRGSQDVEHAIADDATLCGLRRDQVDVYRHLFSARVAIACPRCRDLAAAAPTVPCVQELLHDQILAAAEPYREKLLDLLRHGAKIKSWINTPQRHVRHDLDISSLTDGAEAITDLLGAHDEAHRIGIARVPHANGEFVVILPEQGPPLIAWAAGTTGT